MLGVDKDVIEFINLNKHNFKDKERQEDELDQSSFNGSLVRKGRNAVVVVNDEEEEEEEDRLVTSVNDLESSNSNFKFRLILRSIDKLTFEFNELNYYFRPLMHESSLPLSINSFDLIKNPLIECN